MSARGLLALVGVVLIFLIGLPLALLALSAGRWAEVGGELDALVNTLLLAGGCGLLATLTGLPGVWRRRRWVWRRGGGSGAGPGPGAGRGLDRRAP